MSSNARCTPVRNKIASCWEQLHSMRFRIPEHLRKQKLVHGPLHHQPEGNEDTDEDLTAKQK